MVATRDQVRGLLEDGLDYQAVGRRLGIPAGQAYLIATGMPADGGDTYPPSERQQRPGILPSAQQLTNPPHANPTSRESVHEWMKARVRADRQMRQAAEQRDATPGENATPG